jgi:hypothetical protein
MDLCILLHQVDDQYTHEVVKKVLRKAIRQRVKKLGLKYDAAVSILLPVAIEVLTLTPCNSQSSNTGTRFITTILKFTSRPTISPILLK